MTRSRKTIALIAFLSMSVGLALAQTRHRPISDFISTQIQAAAWGDADTTYAVFFDYAGTYNASLIAAGYPDLGTIFLGDISEAVMPDGRTHVSIVLHTQNAVTFGYSVNSLAALLGFRKGEILGGASPVLGDGTLTVDFAHAVPPGGPLPDFVPLCFYPTPDQQVMRMSFTANVKGPLRAAFGVPEGTPGMVQTTQVILTTPGKGKPLVLNSGSPSDWVKIRVVRK